MISTEFVCKCGKLRGWITEGEKTMTPCPECGREYEGKYNRKKLTIEAVEIKATKPFLPYRAPRFLRVIEFHIRTKIFKQRRYLIDKWRIANGCS
jgi:hypothetical protein